MPLHRVFPSSAASGVTRSTLGDVQVEQKQQFGPKTAVRGEKKKSPPADESNLRTMCRAAATIWTRSGKTSWAISGGDGDGGGGGVAVGGRRSPTHFGHHGHNDALEESSLLGDYYLSQCRGGLNLCGGVSSRISWLKNPSNSLPCTRLLHRCWVVWWVVSEFVIITAVKFSSAPVPSERERGSLLWGHSGGTLWPWTQNIIKPAVGGRIA